MPSPSAWLLRFGPPSVPTYYRTTFPLTEDPLSEGGKWVTGKTTGLDWNDPLSAAGKSYADVNSGLSGNAYDDSIAHLATSYRTFTRAQYAQATDFVTPGYTGNGSSHENELLLLFNITGHSATGYECSHGMNDAIGPYAFIVRWNGTIGNYVGLIDPSGGTGSYTNAPTAFATGDVWKAAITNAGVITLTQNNVLIVTATDTTYTSGQPGVGFWPSGAAPDRTKFGITSWQADDGA